MCDLKECKKSKEFCSVKTASSNNSPPPVLPGEPRVQLPIHVRPDAAPELVYCRIHRREGANRVWPPLSTHPVQRNGGCPEVSQSHGCVYRPHRRESEQIRNGPFAFPLPNSFYEHQVYSLFLAE